MNPLGEIRTEYDSPMTGWVIERLERAISKGVYKCNAAGPTKVRVV